MDNFSIVGFNPYKLEIYNFLTCIRTYTDYKIKLLQYLIESPNLNFLVQYLLVMFEAFV